MWYGKGPGVDRCGDVFKHANNAGSAKHGGVLVLAGDDHAAKSSSTAHQSDHILNACGIPVLYPSSVQEYIDYGLHAWAMSRYTGLWVSMKCVTDIIESGAAVDFDPDRVQITLPTDFEMPAGGLNIRWPDTVLEQEVRMNSYKWYAALAYARANKLNKIIWDSPKARIGIITAGKSYLDTRQALADLGIDEQTASDIGIRLYKIGMTWPLEADGVHEFARRDPGGGRKAPDPRIRAEGRTLQPQRRRASARGRQVRRHGRVEQPEGYGTRRLAAAGHV